MKVLVTGGAGFIGSNIVKILLDRNHDVIVLDNLYTGHEKNLTPYKERIKFVNGDIREYKTVNECMKGVDAVCHLAASVGNKKSIDDPHHDASCNIQGVINILESMRENNVNVLTFSSSAGIFGEPQYQPVDEVHPCEPDSPYGATKLGGEKLILSYSKLYNIRATSFRYFNVYGENQRFDAYGNVIPIFVSRMLKGEDITIFGDGEQTRDFIHVKDIAMANVIAAEKEGVSGAINLGSGKPISINKLANMIKEYNPSISIHHGDVRPGDVRHCTAKTEKMNNLLGLDPEMINESMLKTYIEWFKSDLQ